MITPTEFNSMLKSLRETVNNFTGSEVIDITPYDEAITDAKLAILHDAMHGKDTLEKYNFIDGTRSVKFLQIHYIQSEDKHNVHSNEFKNIREHSIQLFNTKRNLDVNPGQNFREILDELFLLSKEQLEFVRNQYIEVDVEGVNIDYLATSIKNLRNNFDWFRNEELRYILTPALLISDTLANTDKVERVKRIATKLSTADMSQTSKNNLQENLSFVSLVASVGLANLNDMLENQPKKVILSAHNKLVRAKQTTPNLGQYVCSREGLVLRNSVNRLIEFYK